MRELTALMQAGQVSGASPGSGQGEPTAETQCPRGQEELGRSCPKSGGEGRDSGARPCRKVVSDSPGSGLATCFFHLTGSCVTPRKGLNLSEPQFPTYAKGGRQYRVVSCC